MLTSTQIAAMIQQQNQAFAGAASYAQQISTQMPQIMQGAGTIGSYAQQRGPQYQQSPYLPPNQAGFNYGGNQTQGYGFGNRMGGAGVSALGGAAHMGLGALGMFGGAVFDPLAGGMAGFAAARGAGMGMSAALGMGAVAAAPAMAIGLAGSHIIGSAVSGAQEQSAVYSALGQFNQINPASRSGRGFSRTDASGISSMMREMQALPEMMTSMSELTRIMDKLGQMGAMQGSRDATDFKKKFKEQVDTLKTVAQAVGTSMEEALPLLQQSKAMGFHSKQAIVQNAVNAQTVGGMTGMSTQQVMQMQMQGSQMSFALGGTRAGGARGVARIAGEVGMANKMGILSSEHITEMTGLEGAEGIQALAGTLNEAGFKMARSSLGNAMTMALGKKKDGRYTGEMDEELVERVRSGQISKGELISLARQKTSGRGAKLSYSAHRKSLTGAMVNSVGVQGITMELGGILGERGWSNPDALNLVMQRYGIDEREAETIVKLGKEMPNIQSEMASSGKAEGKRIAQQAFLAEHASFSGLKTKIGKRIENVVTEPFKRMGASISNAISEATDNFVDEIFGRYSTKITQEAADIANTAAMGNKGSQRAMAIADNFLQKNIRGKGRPSRLGLMSEMTMNRLSGTHSALEDASFVSERVGSFGDPASAGKIKSYLDSKEGQLASKQVEEFLIRDEEYAKAKTPADKMRRLQEGLGPHLRGNQLTGYRVEEGVLGEAHKAGIGKESQYQLLHAAAARHGMAGALPSADEVSKTMGGFDLGKYDKATLAKDIRDRISRVSGRFGKESASVKSMLEEGGPEARVLRAAFDSRNRAAADEIKHALAGGDPVSKATLDAMGISPAKFEEMRKSGALGAAVRAGENSGKADLIGRSLGRIGTEQLSMQVLLGEEHRKEIGKEMRSHLVEHEAGNVEIRSKGSKEAQTALKALESLAGKLEGGKGSVEDYSSAAEALTHLKGKEKTALLSQADARIRQGAMETEKLRKSFGRGMSEKERREGGHSLHALGLDAEGLEKRGITGALAVETSKEITAIADRDRKSGVSKDEYKEIEETMRRAAIQGKLVRPGAEAGTTMQNAEKLKSILEQMDTNTKLTTQAVTALGVKAGVVDKDSKAVEKKETEVKK